MEKISRSVDVAIYMFNNFKWKYAINLFLVVCVLSTNHIIIYNEELLVALCFLFFVIFVAHYYGNNIGESLDSSSQAIKETCEDLTNSKQQSLEKSSAVLSNTTKYKTVFTELKKVYLGKVAYTDKDVDQVRSHFYQQMSLQCGTLNEAQGQLQPALVTQMAKNQIDLVLAQYAKQSAGSAKLDPKLLRSMISIMAKK